MNEAQRQRIREHIRRSTGINISEQQKEKDNKRREQIMRHLRLSSPE